MAEATHFERLGLPRRYALDPAALERNYLDLSRAVHPDHAANAAGAIAAAAAINEAYTVLRDPFRRADYLLTLAGGPSPSAVSQPPPEFLEEMLELRMQIEEAKADPTARADLERALSSRRDRLLDDAGRWLDNADGSADRLAAVRRTLNAVKFLNGLLRDLAEEMPGA
jgi:molecular chaperone HscB